MASYPNEQTTSKTTARRCVNLDWMEVHAREPIEKPLDADYYRQAGFIVHEREYGTRVYREMFVLDGSDGEPLLEIRRNPASQGLNGIHDPNECHIRLTNRTCYFDNAAELFDKFLKAHRYTDVRISRADICLDFVTFDKGDDPQAFVRRYFRHKYAKINQGRISSHGDDTWTGQEWNSLAWGSKTSPISTKMYNKTMELHDPKTDSFKKPYIRQAWQICGLIDDMQRVTKDGERVYVWRVEFSIRSAVKNWVPIEIDGNEKNYQSIKNSLECYYDRGRMLMLFAALSRHYFRFKKYKANKRKDRCPDKVLFDFTSVQETYKVGRPDYAAGSGNSLTENYERLIAKLRMYQQSHSAMEIHKACETLISAMTEDNLRNDMANPWSREELNWMKMMLHLRTRDKNLSFEVAMKEIKKLLAINDRTFNCF